MQERRAARSTQDDAGRELVSGREHDRIKAVEIVDLNPLLVDGQRASLSASRFDDRLTLEDAWVLEAYCGRAIHPKRVDEEGQTLTHACADDDLVWICLDAADPAQVRGER
jgi:hypothetical protein